MKRVVVIGGGVIGLCTAYYAAQRGHEVIIVDQRDEEHEGCSYGNAGMVVPSHFVPLAAPGMVALGLKWMWNPESPFYIKPRFDLGLWNWGFQFWRAANAGHVKRSAPLLRDLSFASRDAFQDLSRQFDFGLVQRGLLMLCKTQHTLDEEAKMAAEAERLGVPARVLSPREAAQLEPGVAMDVAGAVYFPKDCHLAPSAFMRGLKALLQTRGVRFLWGSRVEGFNIKDRRVSSLRTRDQELTADEYVIAGGSWSSGIAKSLAMNIPMQAGKGYSVTLADTPKLPSICAIFTEARVAVTPMGNSLRFAGTMEIDEINERINPVRVNGILKAIPRYYPEFCAEDFREVKPWCGLRPCSPDGLPYVGRARYYDNVSIATGHAMMGLSLGPITGKLISELVSDDQPSIDISLLNPNRYQRK